MGVRYRIRFTARVRDCKYVTRAFPRIVHILPCYVSVVWHGTTPFGNQSGGRYPTATTTISSNRRPRYGNWAEKCHVLCIGYLEDVAKAGQAPPVPVAVACNVQFRVKLRFVECTPQAGYLATGLLLRPGGIYFRRVAGCCGGKRQRRCCRGMIGDERLVSEVYRHFPTNNVCPFNMSVAGDARRRPCFYDLHI